MDKNDRILTVRLNCPGIGAVSQVVENALEEALLSALTFGDCIPEGLWLGVYEQNLDDQFFEQDGYVQFDGNEQEQMNYQREPQGCHHAYHVEMKAALKTLSELNEEAIMIVQTRYPDARLRLIKGLPNHWIIAVEGG